MTRHAGFLGRFPQGSAWSACTFLLVLACGRELPAAAGNDPSPPASPVKLVFVHHSCGENWLADEHGGLGLALERNNYFVSDTNYGWGPDGIGDRTDITDWPEWFTGPESGRFLAALFAESSRHSEYTRTLADPGGENRVILFKSCFPNSNLAGAPDDPPARGEGLTVGNAKAIYNELLPAFAARPDRLFVIVTAPPVQDPAHARNARAFNAWLVKDWLADYEHDNVAVFDFYNVLTGPDCHHRCRDGAIEHAVSAGRNTLHYPSDGDDHPAPPGNRKATAEFVPLLNVYYHRWQEGAAAAVPAAEPEPPDVTPAAPPGAAPPPVEAEPPDVTPAQAPGAEPAAPPDAEQGALIDDFESGCDAWAVFSDGAEETRVSRALDPDNARAGQAGLRVEYDIGPGGYGLCGLVHPSPRDWKASSGASFYFHCERAGQEIVFIAYNGASPEDLAVFEIRVTAGQEAVAGWQRAAITWDQLSQPSWQGDAAARFDPARAMGVAFSIDPPESGRSRGWFCVDDIALE
ncbi:MAG: hypothetical protein HY812_19540 [Planctomycetes bacterium]|nr:hypothetical protein [Planctomycetota bacterium]